MAVYSVVITGGAGFVGSSLALALTERHPSWQIRAFDNLKRRGSELALSRLAQRGIQFVHGDVRDRADLHELGRFDLLIDCAAEPSVIAGNASYVLDTNLGGTLNCLELARAHQAGVLFISTSRVYPIAAIEQLPFVELATRFAPEPNAKGLGYSELGLDESFPLAGARSLYGASKLCSELIIQEYVEAYGLRAVIDRCGVLTGPWQMGKVDQGVIMHWVASHVFDKSLRYIGYGGGGKQVRDILHVRDLAELVDRQIGALQSLAGDVFNVGGGVDCSISLRELTGLCQQATGRAVTVDSEAETRRADIRMYLSDCRKVQQRFDWRPRENPATIVEDIARWVHDERRALEPILFDK
ncbi:MAG TPA: NAD-dependent epimerase/dehydratase family protein [Polyangiales bacterium]|jgi:CDP-paratose 2-epimerase|nr:NAD-dependent epimerase/dehydratase family protein [Polyangiales bacterium]